MSSPKILSHDGKDQSVQPKEGDGEKRTGDGKESCCIVERACDNRKTHLHVINVRGRPDSVFSCSGNLGDSNEKRPL